MHITVRAYATSGRLAETGHLKFTKMNNDGLFVLVVIGFEPVTTGCHIDKLLGRFIEKRNVPLVITTLD